MDIELFVNLSPDDSDDAYRAALDRPVCVMHSKRSDSAFIRCALKQEEYLYDGIITKRYIQTLKEQALRMQDMDDEE